MSSYDLGNLCRMFRTVLKSVLIANQDGNADRVAEICQKTMSNIKKLECHCGPDAKTDRDENQD